MRTTFVRAVVALLLGSAAAGAQVSGPPGRALLVTSDSALVLQAWRPGVQPGTFDSTWSARPRSVDPATWATRRGDAVSPPRDASPVIADLDGDGSKELIVVDTYGLTAYGRTPRYFPFASASDMGTPTVAAGDLDGVAGDEIVLQRNRMRGQTLSREVEVLGTGPGGLTSLWKGEFPGLGGGVAIGDADNDKVPEILAGGYSLLVLERKAGSAPAWEVGATLLDASANVIAVRVGDVNQDGRNEIVTTGDSGKVTVYKYRKTEYVDQYFVFWQSRFMAAASVKNANVMGQSLALADVTGDGRLDIVTSAMEFGKLGDRDVRAPRLHVFTFDAPRDFVEVWASDHLALTSGAGLSAGDLDGDRVAEVVIGGRQVFRYDAVSKAFRSSPTGCATCSDGVIGELGPLAEPAAATRLVPLYWNVPGRQIAEGQTLNVALTLFNPFAEAKDVTVSAVPANARLEVKGGPVRVASVPAGGTVTLPPIAVTARAGSENAALRFEIAADGGYRTSVPATLYVGPALPTYQADAQPGLAKALEGARHENRRALVVWGARAEQPSQDFILTMARNGEVAHTLLYEYEVVRAERAGNARLAAKYKVPKGPLPYLTVLDAQGAVLANQPATTFKATGEGAAAWDGTKLNGMLTKFKPTYVNAEPVFTAALARAKKEGKTLFLWFNAPW